LVELESIRRELAVLIESKGRLAVVFDGATRVCETAAVVARFVQQDWNIRHVLVRLAMMESHLDGVGWANVIFDLVTRLGISRPVVIGLAHDRASVNSVIVRTLTPLFPLALDIPCVSHSCDLIGPMFVNGFLDDFLGGWNTIIASPNALVMWKRLTGLKKPESSSDTRWWSEHTQAVELLQCFGDVKKFLLNLKDGDCCAKSAANV
jgi:hypothetical protein